LAKIASGDLNIDMLGNQCGHLEDILTRLNLENVVWEPTRITHTSAIIFKENTPILAFHFMDYGIIISLIIFSNCAFITLLFTRFDIYSY
jgi:hypothetical protein